MEIPPLLSPSWFVLYIFDTYAWYSVLKATRENTHLTGGSLQPYHPKPISLVADYVSYSFASKSVQAANLAESSWELEKYSPHKHEEAASGRGRTQKVIKKTPQTTTAVGNKSWSKEFLNGLFIFILKNLSESLIMALVRNSTDLHCKNIYIKIFISITQF